MRRAARVFDDAAFWLFVALVVWAPIPLGSNRPWAWSLLEIGIYLVGILWLLAYAGRGVGFTPVLRGAWPALGLFGLWLAWLAVQWMPLPMGWVAVLSPRAPSKVFHARTARLFERPLSSGHELPSAGL